MITLEDLQQAITQRIDTYNQTDFPIAKRETQTCTLLDSQNHILAQDIASPLTIPRQDVSAMDGYGIAAGSDLSKDATIEIIGESQAGTPFSGSLQAGQGVRIFTGAVVPSDCNTVIMQENTNFAVIKNTIDKSQPYLITLSELATVDSNIRKQGEEINLNEVVLTVGKRLNPADISLLANLGIDKVNVYKPLVVGLLATGDELVALGEPLTHLAQIYNSNTPTLKSMLSDLPITIRDYGIIPDSLEQTTSAVTKAMHECDVLISTAGVSVGDYDFLTLVIEQLGKINHYKVAMKPGKPFVFGELNRGVDKPVLYFGLPGNPLSTVVGTLQLVMPALWRLSGVRAYNLPMALTVQATLKEDIKKSVGRKDFQRGILSQDSKGNFEVVGFAKQQSHRIKYLSQANCMIVLAQETGNVAAGEMVQVQPFPWS
ncbi:molybdopterin molybdotransferase MoeA [Psychrobacter urativorans]|uniref:Molybdopterin molybdenumtransferase n=1 Tax=Psychrobacter urativorans TaxID=45610 RepID=A0A0M5MKH1_9GAMM|nr:molybdopterin molybdotransferase MoeA [Psychrobacter urativorans]ALF60842.1 molybdopterin biosynthesis protein MoeA [Psychrobacter urativorans]